MFKSPDRLQRIFKEGFWIVAGQAMVVIGSLVGVRLLTGMLDPAEYGELTLGITIATLINQLILGPLSQGIVRFYSPAVEEDRIGSYLYGVRELISIASLVIIGVMLVGTIGLFLAGRSDLVGITISALIFASISGYNYVLSGIQNAARQRAIVAVHQGIDYWLRFLVAAALIAWLGTSSSVAMIGYAVGGTIVFVSQSIFFLRVFPHPRHWHNDKNIWQHKIWEYAWPMSTFGIFTWSQQVSDRWALGLFQTTEQVGMYAALFQLGYYPISMATGMLVQLLQPIFFQRSGDGSDNQRTANVVQLSWRLTSLALGFTVLAFCFAFLFHVQIFQLCVAKEYRQVSYLLPWMILGGGIFAAGQTMTLNLLSKVKTYQMMPVKIMTSSLGIGLNLAGGYYWGIPGLIVAGIIFSVSYLLSIIIISKH